MPTPLAREGIFTFFCMLKIIGAQTLCCDPWVQKYVKMFYWFCPKTFGFRDAPHHQLGYFDTGIKRVIRCTQHALYSRAQS